MNTKQKTRIMAFGTFDVLHKGHLNFFLQARKLSNNPWLVVSVARDANVFRIKKRKPLNNEKLRMAKVRACALVDKVILGGVKSYLPHIIKQRPQIVALGYDQRAYVGNLARLLLKAGLKVKIVRLKAFKPQLYKSSLVKVGLPK